MSEFFRKSLYRPSAPKLLEVKRVTEVTPGLVSVTLTGNDLSSFPVHCPAAHVKLFLPLTGQAKPALPTLGPDGPVWPKNEAKPIVRTYSVRQFRPDSLELDIEFAVHGVEGPATAFARAAEPGHFVGVSYPGGPDPMIPPAELYVLAGDMSAAPGIASILEHLADNAVGQVFLRADSHHDVRPLKKPKGMSLYWFVCEPDNLSQIVADFELKVEASDSTFFWLGGEHNLVVTLKAFLTRECGVKKEMLYALPYWRYRFSEEGYHDQRDEVMAES